MNNMKKIPGLSVTNLHVSVDGREILKGVNLSVKPGEIVAIMGPNGNGKSTLLKAIMGHPRYSVDKGTITVGSEKINELAPDERSRLGVFLGAQHPPEIPGVLNADFIRAALSSHQEKPVDVFQLYQVLKQNVGQLSLPHDTAERFVNDGFSGGERKKNEILQLKILRPTIVMLDEIDSGLDVDAMALIARELNDYVKQTQASLILVSHYERLFKLIVPTTCHIMLDGRIAVSGGSELVTRIDESGYDWARRQGAR